MSNVQIDERGREQVPAWYGIAITTNKEKLIRKRIQALAKTDMWKDQIFDAILPSWVEVNEKGKEVEKLFYTQIGYVHMILNTDTWNALEMLRGIGFRAILPAGSPQPITDDEMKRIFEMIGREEKEELIFSDTNVLEIKIGDTVKVINEDGILNGQTGVVEEVFENEKEVLVTLDLLGKETKARVSFNEIEVVE